MLRVNYSVSYGEITVKGLSGKNVKVQIHPANALCAFICHYKDENGTKMAQLWNFLIDTEHGRRIIKNSSDHTLLGTSVIKVRLNVFYKESMQLVKLMALSGYKTEVFYKKQ